MLIKEEIDNGKSIKYKMKLSKLVKYLPERLHGDNCTDYKSHLEYISVKDDQLIFRCFEFKKNYEKDFNKKFCVEFGIWNFVMEASISLFCC